MNKKIVIGLLLTVVCAAAGGSAAWSITSSGVPDETYTTERARMAADGLGESHVYVDPASEEAFTAEELARIDEAAAAADPQVFVVVWPESRQAGYRSGRDVLRQIGLRLDRPGVYLQVSPESGGLDSADVGIDAERFSVSDSPDEQWSSSRETSRLLEKIAENDGRDYELGESTHSSDWEGTAGVIAAGLLIGVFGGGLVGAMGLTGWFIVRRRRAAA
ncbi:hypothetical protein [Phytoactinopolyspora mesophila]|uniref:TPM domain-containing protein n=1 Tax=Phytoactinopolyspora mesophila TaxID=2650750 RepID=A0A7K3M262_9ACTN|nr:hypothetical protein [Phytoactinopolyspora mesophila]NDL56518.1 hypothetical protein [Phytoactinopolyspora mesophila]